MLDDQLIRIISCAHLDNYIISTQRLLMKVMKYLCLDALVSKVLAWMSPDWAVAVIY